MCGDPAIKRKFIKVTRSDAEGSYIQHRDMLDEAIDAEFDEIEYLEDGTSFTLTVVSMTDEEYESLEEFDGW